MPTWLRGALDDVGGEKGPFAGGADLQPGNRLSVRASHRQNGAGLDPQTAAGPDKDETARRIDVMDDPDGENGARRRPIGLRSARYGGGFLLRLLRGKGAATDETTRKEGGEEKSAGSGERLHLGRLGDTAPKSKIAEMIRPCMNVFVYGTLLVPEIWDRVTRVPGLVSHPAELGGHAIRRVRGAAYPGIFVSPDTVGTVPGKVLFDVPDAALHRLDAYEDRFYLREEVHPEVAGMGIVAAQAYLVPAEEAGAILSGEPWTLEWFLANGLERFRSSILSTRTRRPTED